MLELDHLFAIVTDPDDASARLEADGWSTCATAAPSSGVGVTLGYEQIFASRS